jgi:hypothetical protein
MQNYHHKPIKRFGLEGVIYDDSAIVRLKDEYIRLLRSEMVLTGYVQRLDINPDFTISFDHKRKVFEFTISLYGVYVGKNKAQWITGIDETKVIPSQKSKSKEFSEEQV